MGGVACSGDYLIAGLSKCASCRGTISVRYPIVEAVTGALFAFCAWRFGITLTAGFWMVFCAILICQFLIDLDTQLLPDTLTYVLLWLGLAGSALKVDVRTDLNLAHNEWLLYLLAQPRESPAGSR